MDLIPLFWSLTSFLNDFRPNWASKSSFSGKIYNFQNVFKPKGTLFKQNESISQKKNIGKLSSSVRSSVVVKKLKC